MYLSTPVLACLAILTCVPDTLAYTYKLESSLTGNALLNFFNFQTGKADNGGVAYYLSLAKAKAAKLVSVNSKTGAVTLRVATTPKTSQRGSVRLFSKVSFSGGGLFIFDVPHIPTGCGGWPAIWATGSNWPTDGELDIIEGVNHMSMNSMSSHTNAGCIQKESGFTGKFMMSGSEQNNCNTYATNCQGCGVRSQSTTSFGAPFNAAGGGTYALEWSSAGAKTFHWLRGHVPKDITSGHPSPSSAWGVPENFVAASDCSPFEHFKDLMLVINTNLCGTWAAGVWDQDLSYAGGKGSCAAKTGFSTCEAFVANSGSQLSELYWTINSIKIYK